MHVNNRDQNSGILIRKGTRCETEDDLRAHAGERVFQPISTIDHYEVRQKNRQQNQTVGCYTIGVLTDVSPVQTSKKGTKFCIMKLSDLNKYDLNKVKPTY